MPSKATWGLATGVMLVAILIWANLPGDIVDAVKPIYYSLTSWLGASSVKSLVLLVVSLGLIIGLMLFGGPVMLALRILVIAVGVLGLLLSLGLRGSSVEVAESCQVIGEPIAANQKMRVPTDGTASNKIWFVLPRDGSVAKVEVRSVSSGRLEDIYLVDHGVRLAYTSKISSWDDLRLMYDGKDLDVPEVEVRYDVLRCSPVRNR